MEAKENLRFLDNKGLQKSSNISSRVEATSLHPEEACRELLDSLLEEEMTLWSALNSKAEDLSVNLTHQVIKNDLRVRRKASGIEKTSKQELSTPVVNVESIPPTGVEATLLQKGNLRLAR